MCVNTAIDINRYVKFSNIKALNQIKAYKLVLIMCKF